MLIGDFYQLLLVGQMALYRELFNKVLELTRAGRLAYKAINQIAVLDRVMRQGGDDTKSATFKSALAELYNNTVDELT